MRNVSGVAGNSSQAGSHPRQVRKGIGGFHREAANSPTEGAGMDALTEALLAGVDAEKIEDIDLPDTYLAAHLRIGDLTLFDGVQDRDVRKSIHVAHVPMPALAPDEV